LGWLIKPPKKHIHHDGILALLYSQRKLAEFLGEWSFYILVVVLLIALIKTFSYSLFRFIHRIIPLLYLALAFHAVILFQFNYWRTPSGIILGLLVLGGVVAAMISLLNQIGACKKYPGKIVELRKLVSSNSLTITLEAESWRGHTAGQFALVKLSRDEAAHPFSIASGWDIETKRLTFIIKELGDYTKTLAQKLHVGDKVLIEGPYGGFKFEMASGISIWVATGVGITPFIAKLEERIKCKTSQAKIQIDLFYCTNETDEEFLQQLTGFAIAADVKLHLISGKDNRLTGERLRNLVPNYQHASVWYCGNKQFAASLLNDLSAHGLPLGSFHQEFCEFR
jgi:predicted ferric reductase